MKTKSFGKLFFVMFFCGMMLLSLFLFLPSKVSADEVAEPSVAVINNGTPTTQLPQYPYSENGYAITLCIIDFEFAENETVAYYCKNTGIDSVAYKYLGTIDNTIKDKDGNIIKDENGDNIPNPNRKIENRFYVEAGSGDFLIKAIILQDGKVLDVFPKDLNISIATLDVNDIKPKIVITDFGVVGGEYSTYSFHMEFTKNEKKVDIPFSNYQIKWYYLLNDNVHFLGSDERVNWTPTQNGDYTIKADIYFGGNKLDPSPSVDINNVSKNYSLYAIIVFGGVAVILTIIVIATTVRKVKKERVW